MSGTGARPARQRPAAGSPEARLVAFRDSLIPLVRIYRPLVGDPSANQKFVTEFTAALMGLIKLIEAEVGYPAWDGQ